MGTPSISTWQTQQTRQPPNKALKQQTIRKHQLEKHYIVYDVDDEIQDNT